MLLLSITTLVLLLGVAELVLRRCSPRQLGFEYTGGIFRTPSEVAGDGKLNSLGFHDAEPKRRSGVERVLLLGDSYVAGLAVSLDATVGRRLERHLVELSARDFEVVSFGKPGWGTRQELVELRARMDAFHPARVVLLFLPFNDVRNNSPALEARATAESHQHDRARPGWSYLRRDEAPFFVFEHSVLNQLVSFRLARCLSRRSDFVPTDYWVYALPADAECEAAWTTTVELLRAVRDFCRERGAAFVLVSASTPHGVLGRDEGLAYLRSVYPGMRDHAWDLDAPNARLERFAREQGIDFLSLEPAFREATAHGARLHLPYNGHWSAAGHDLAGELIARHLLAR